jgi:hypothetical protein
VSVQAVPQHMVALARANEIRLAGSSVKRELASRSISFGEAIGDERAGSLQVVKLLSAVPRVGPKTAASLCACLPVLPLKRVEFLTERQRSVLVGLVEGTGK